MTLAASSCIRLAASPRLFATPPRLFAGASRRLFAAALAVSTLITLATIVLVHRSGAPGSNSFANAIAFAAPQVAQRRSIALAPHKAPAKLAGNASSLYSGALALSVIAQESLVTHEFEIPSDAAYQIQIIFEIFGAKLRAPVRMQLLINFIHRMELADVVVDSAAPSGWWTVGTTALPAGAVSVSVQRIDKNAAARVVLNGIRLNFMGGGRYLGGEDCVSTQSVPDVFFSGDVFKCAQEQQVAFIDDTGKLNSQTCAQSDLVLLVPGHDSALRLIDLKESQQSETLIAQCKSRDKSTPASFLTRILKKPDVGLQANVASQKISVVHVFMDSIARAVGIMKLPKTMNLLRNIRLSNDFKQWQLLDMRGYSVLGGGTNRNMPPMVAGSEGRDAPAWDAPGWLFNDFRNKGYVTGFAADECVLDHNSMVRIMSQEWSGSGSKFKDSLKKELREKADAIAHHTLYNVICGMQEYGDLDDNWYSGSSLCFSGKPVAEHLFDYGRKFMSTYADRDKFFWFSIQEGHEPMLLRVETIDESLHKFLEFVLGTAASTRTIVNLIADHGLGYGDYWTTSDFAKNHEKRPLWMMLISPTLAETPSFMPFMQQARRNEGRLVTPFDVYATMQHILSFPGPIPTFPSDRSSIFQPLSDQRTCHTLNIPPEWCLCTLFSSESRPKDKPDYDLLAAVATDHINRQAASESKVCRPLTAGMIEKIEVDQTQQHYTVTFSVAPTSGKPFRQAEIFEARFSVLEPPEKECGDTKACVGSPVMKGNMLKLRVGMRFDDASTVFHSLYGIVVRGEMMWEYFSWSGDDDEQHDYELAYTDDSGRVWESKTHVVNKGITSNWRWWQPSLDEMKVGRHSLTMHALTESADNKDVKVKGELIAEFIFYAVNPPNRGSIVKAPLLAMGKSVACSGKKASDDPILVIGSTSAKRESELSLLQLWDRKGSFAPDDCTYTAELTSTCGDISEARKQLCPGKQAASYSSRLLLEEDDSNSDEDSNAESDSEASSSNSFGHADSGIIAHTFPTSACTRISSGACDGVWKHRVYDSSKNEIGQSLIFVGGESWGIPSDRSIVGDLDEESLSMMKNVFKLTATRRLSRYAPDESCSPRGVEAQFCICSSS